MVGVLEDFADSYGEGYDDGFVHGWDECEYATEFGYSDENHYDPYYEGYIQGAHDTDSINCESKPNVVIGVQCCSTDNNVPVNRRFLISVQEASEYYGLGVKTLYRVIRNNPEADFILEIGSHYKIKRELFEEYLRYSTNLD